jgi:predicted Fe-Mo cluster-binding NifX family protein
MLAIPVLRSRVAPVLNWCSSIHLFPDDPAHQGVGQVVHVSHLDPGQRLDLLRDRGVKTLICGALSPDLLYYAQKLGIKVVCGVAGEVEDVRRSYWQDGLDQPQFWLPGCRGPRRYRSGFRGRGCPGLPRGSSRSRISTGGIQGLAGNKAVCLCPACGFQQPHERGIPCHQTTCPRCGQRLARG